MPKADKIKENKILLSNMFRCMCKSSSSKKNSVKSLKKTQSGRSMVEMLGVLAVIGLLSVIGISAYSTAMKKHQANTLFDEALKRAVVVAGHLGFGLTHPSLNDFPTVTEYGTFASDIEPVNQGKQFILSVSDVKQELCDYLRTIAEASKIVQNFEPTTCSAGNNTLRFTFNNDLSSTNIPTENTPPIDCSEDENVCTGCQTCQNGFCQDNSSECAENETCSNGTCIDNSTNPTEPVGSPRSVDCSTDENACLGCQVCNSSTGLCEDDNTKCNSGSCSTGLCTCSDGRAICNDTCCAEGTVCGKKSQNANATAYKCLTPSGSGCTKNTDCGSQQYCKLTGNGCFSPESGSCIDISDSDFTQVIYNNRTFYVGPQMNWWAAENFCLAHGKKLAHLASLGLSKNYTSSTPNGPLYQAFIGDPNLLDKNTEGKGNFYWLANNMKNACPAISINIQTEAESVITLTEYRYFVRDHALCE